MPLTFMYAGIDRLIILSQPLAAPTGNRQQEQSPSPRPITKGERLAFPAFACGSYAGQFAVMRRIAMTRDPADDFDDPTAPEGPLRRNVLYRIACPQTAS
jgi:hypothetical protein